MHNRYIERYRLPGRRYTKSSPVILCAGALLEDRQKPRLVVQLKFRSISPKVLAGITVLVCCVGADGDALESREFTYSNLRIRRGAEFGQFTALALPISGAQRFTALVTAAVFSDGERWTRGQGGATAARPPAAAAEPAAASPVPMTADSAEPREAASDIPAAPEEPEPAPAAEAAHVELIEALKKTRRAPRIKGKWLGLASVCIAVVTAAVILLPRLLGGGDEATGKTPATPAPSAVGSPGDAERGSPAPTNDKALSISTGTDGETVTCLFEQDVDGNCTITFDMLREILPEMNHFVFDGTARMGESIDDYILDSFHMAQLVGTRGAAGSDEMYGRYSAVNDPDSNRCLLLFSDLFTLCGYAVGIPGDEGGGRWSLDITRCDYDFEELYERASAGFYGFQQPPFIPYNDIAGSGAAYFLHGYNMKEAEQANNTQLFHMWSQYTSEYGYRHARDIGTLDRRVPREGRTMFYYLLDADYNLIGYSRLINNVNGAVNTDTAPADAARAPQNLRLEVRGQSYVQLIWDTPSWATDATWALIEAKRVTDIDWTNVNTVHVKSETSRAVSSLVLPWSEPRDGDRYQFRVRFAERDENYAGQSYDSYTGYTLCPGTLTCNIEAAPFAAAAQYEGSLTLTADFKANAEYFFLTRSPEGRISSGGGFTTGATGMASYDMPAADYPNDLTGQSLFVWELTGASLSGSNVSVSIRAMPEAATIG